MLAVGEGARRYADVLGTLPMLSWPGRPTTIPARRFWPRWPPPRPSVPLHEITPLYLRGAEVRIGWEQRPLPPDSHRHGGPAWLTESAWSRRTTRPALDVRLVPLRRRHLRSVLRIEAQVYPRPWSLALFMSELNLRNSRHYVAARIGNAVVGYGGLMFTGDEAHVTNIAVDPAWHRHQIGTRLLLNLARASIGPRAPGT